MGYFKSNIKYVAIGIIALISIAVACSDSVKTNHEPADVDVNDLVQSTEFDNMVRAVQEINKPIIDSLKVKDAEELEAFRKKIEKHFDPETKQLRPSSSLDDLVAVLGYENKQEYIKLSQSLQNKLSKFIEKYPSFKSLDTEKTDIMDQAVGQILQANASKFDMPTVADCDEDFLRCMERANYSFTRTTVICVIGSRINLVAAIYCQAANIIIYELDKYGCRLAHDECKAN